jgi:hypothetical protein
LKLLDLTETLFANAQVLNDLVSLILDQWPDTIPANSKYVIGQPHVQLDPRIGMSGPVPGIDNLIEKYEDYPQLVRGLRYFRSRGWVELDNTSTALEHTGTGYYHWGKKYVVVNVAGLQGRTNIFRKAFLKHFKSAIFETLVHELRHYFQDVDFGSYLQSSHASKGEWSSRPVEWDAEWNAVITQYNVNRWSDPSEFADAVVDHWVKSINDRSTQYRLPDKQINKYRRKTVRYFFQNNDFFMKSAFKQAIRKNMQLINDRSFVPTALNTFKTLTYDYLSSVAYNRIKSQFTDFQKSINTNNTQRNTT